MNILIYEDILYPFYKRPLCLLCFISLPTYIFAKNLISVFHT